MVIVMVLKLSTMKAIKTLLILCAAFCLVTSCKKEVDLTLVQQTVLENVDIRQIEVSDAWQVTMVADSSTFVELEYSAYLEPKLDVRMDGTQLEIGFSGNVYPVINSVFRARVHTNKIASIELADAAQLVCVGQFFATSDTLYVKLDDASICSGLNYSGHVGKISIENASQFLDFNLSGYNCEVSASEASSCKGIFDMSFHLVANLSEASHLITLGGAAPYGMIKLQDASLLNMAQTQVGEMHVDLTGASEATVDVSNRIEGTLTEASTLYYKGNPQIGVDCSDGSQIIPF